MVHIQDNTNLAALIGGMGMGPDSNQMIPMPAMQRMPLPAPPQMQMPMQAQMQQNPLAALLGMGGGMGSGLGGGVNERAIRMMLYSRLANQLPATGPFTAVVGPLVAALQARQLAPQYAQQQAVEQLKERLQALQIVSQMQGTQAQADLNKARTVTEGAKSEKAARFTEWFNRQDPQTQDRIFATQEKLVADANVQAREEGRAAAANQTAETQRLNRESREEQARLGRESRENIARDTQTFREDRAKVKDQQWLDTYNQRNWEGAQRIVHYQALEDLAGKKFDYTVALNRAKGAAAERRAGETAEDRKAKADRAERQLDEMIRNRISTEQNTTLDNLNQALSRIEDPTAREKAMVDVYLPAFEQATGVTINRKDPGLIKKILSWPLTPPTQIEGIKVPATSALGGGGGERIPLPPREHPLPMVNTAPMTPAPGGGETREDELLNNYIQGR